MLVETKTKQSIQELNRMRFTILKAAPFKPCQMRQEQKLLKTVTLVERIADGKSIYAKTCFACHQATGEGLPNAFPPFS